MACADSRILPLSEDTQCTPTDDKLHDIEKQLETNSLPSDTPQEKQSAFKNLGLLDRFLAVWIFLAMAVGIILGNLVPNTGPALQRGTFVGVSIPIGKYSTVCLLCEIYMLTRTVC